MPTRLRQQKHPFGSLRKDPHWSTKGLVGLWQFKPAGKLIDETSNKNDGTITGATWVAEGLRFDGTDDKVDIPASTVNGNGGTFSAWVKDTTSSAAQEYFSVVSGANYMYVRSDGTFYEVRAFDGSTRHIIDIVAIDTDWHMHTIVWLKG
ncbi:hypothetical protein LCGC14_3010640, partial [marine sediment metagenome]